MSTELHPFETLTPDFIADAIEDKGYWCDGRTFPLNSYENRVYQVGIEEAEPIIAKFYRPNRWTKEQIQEEHDFCFELQEQELPVVAPLKDKDGNSLLHYKGFDFALYPRRGGHAPELDDPDALFTLGRLLGRIHLVGASKPFEHRPDINIQSYGYDSIKLIGEQFIPAGLESAYSSLTDDLMRIVADRMDMVRMNSASNITRIRTHGDCHIGNMLWRDDNAHFVDFDDARTAPAIQDIYMLLTGSDRAEQTAQLSEIIEGYQEFYNFDIRELALIESLRTLRMLHHSAWLARRWEDPAFPRAFPWFNTQRYWEEHILELREQLFLLGEPPLSLMP